MSKTILVGYDPRRGDRASVAFGGLAARFTGAPLVIAAARAPGAPDDLAEWLDRLRGELRASGVEASCRTLAGPSAAHALHDAAEELDAGLLVLGATMRRGAERAIHGSTADRLLHGAPCPVAVVPHGWRAPDRLSVVGAAFTDTPDGREALYGARLLARAAGAKLRVLSAVQPRAFQDGFEETYGGAPMVEATTYTEVGSAMYAKAEGAAAEATSTIDDVEVELDVSVQDPVDFLSAASRRVDLLVCGSRGYGPNRAVLLGGVTSRITLEAACPVIVLERGVEASLETLIGTPTTTG